MPRLPRKCRGEIGACHQRQPSAVSATPATQKQRGCHACPTGKRHDAKGDQVRHQSVRRKVPLGVTKRHACHAKSNVNKEKCQVVCERVVWKVVCDKVVCERVVCDKVVCERLV